MTGEEFYQREMIRMANAYLFPEKVAARYQVDMQNANAAASTALLMGAQAYKLPSKIDRARERFGQPFAHEPGATWTPRKVPVLTEWMQRRGHGRDDVLANVPTRGIR